MVFKICEGILCSSFSVEELDVIVHKNYFPFITQLNFGHSVPHQWELGIASHQILFCLKCTYVEIPKSDPIGQHITVARSWLTDTQTDAGRQQQYPKAKTGLG